MHARKSFIALAAVVIGVCIAGLASAQQGSTSTAQSGFSVENLLMELSSFLPEDKAGFMAFRGGQGNTRPGDAATSQQGGQSRSQQGQTGQAQTGQGQAATGQGGQRFAGMNIPQFKRDPKLFLTAKQVDTLVPVLLDLKKNPYPTPSLAKKVQSTVDGTLTKQQKDAYAKFVKERDKALEELRKQFASRQGQTGTTGQSGTGNQAGGGFILRDEQNGQGGQSGQSGQTGQQRQQRDPAELRAEMLDTFIKNLQDYRKGL